MTSKEKVKFNTFLKRKVFENTEFRYSVLKDLIKYIKVFNFKTPYTTIDKIGYKNMNNVNIKTYMSLLKKQEDKMEFMSHFNLMKIFGMDNKEAILYHLENKDKRIFKFYKEHEIKKKMEWKWKN